MPITKPCFQCKGKMYDCKLCGVPATQAHGRVLKYPDLITLSG